MADVVTIQLRFAVDTALGIYQDQIYFTEDEWANRDQKIIDAQKQRLADTWSVFRAAQISDEQILATEAGKQAKITDLDQKIAILTAEKDTLTASIAAIQAEPAVVG